MNDADVFVSDRGSACAADVFVSDRGSVCILTPRTAAAFDWVAVNVVIAGWQWFGGGFAVDQRFAAALVDGMRDDGLVVAFE